jgi:hypothetical protein
MGKKDGNWDSRQRRAATQLFFKQIKQRIRRKSYPTALLSGKRVYYNRKKHVSCEEKRTA